MSRWTLTPTERFWAKVDKTDGCWLWTARTRNGYGQFRNGQMVTAHRFAYEQLVGPIPTGLDLDHLCRVHQCVNPAHLEPVTRQENIRRGVGLAAVNVTKTHCPKGHPYDEANTIVGTDGKRKCRTCKAAKDRRWYAKRERTTT